MGMGRRKKWCYCLCGYFNQHSLDFDSFNSMLDCHTRSEIYELKLLACFSLNSIIPTITHWSKEFKNCLKLRLRLLSARIFFSCSTLCWCILSEQRWPNVVYSDIFYHVITDPSKNYFECGQKIFSNKILCPTFDAKSISVVTYGNIHMIWFGFDKKCHRSTLLRWLHYSLHFQLDGCNSLERKGTWNVKR